MPTLTLSFAPHTRTADAAVRAPRKNLRVFGSDTVRLLFALIVSGGGLGLPTNARSKKLIFMLFPRWPSQFVGERGLRWFDWILRFVSCRSRDLLRFADKSF